MYNLARSFTMGVQSKDVDEVLDQNLDLAPLYTLDMSSCAFKKTLVHICD